MALRTEAPSTCSQREPSRLEQNTNQRLTGHSHSPHQRGARTPAQCTRPGSTFHFPLSGDGWMLWFFSCHPGQAGPGRDWQAQSDGTFAWVCVCVRAPPALSLGFSRCTGSGRWERGCEPGAESKPAWDWSVTAMLVSALRSASRVQNTNTNCPHNTGLLSDRRGR